MGTISAMHFRVRWPDQTQTNCYSPSLIIKSFLHLGESYAVDDFVARCRRALEIASERVRRKFGYSCAHAAHTLGEIERIAARFAGQPNATIRVEAFED
jgi:uncharacterized repeat protein (TIGR04042 family)